MTTENKILLKIGVLVNLLIVLVVLVVTDPFTQQEEEDFSIPPPDPTLQEKRQIIDFLSTYNSDQETVYRITEEVFAQAKEQDVPASIIVAIMSHETMGLDSLAVSPVGARGLMQVMPLHVKELREPCQVHSVDDLFLVDKNVCSGVFILRQKLSYCNDQPRCALLAYNGCIVRNDQPFRACYNYPVVIEERMLEFWADS